MGRQGRGGGRRQTTHHTVREEASSLPALITSVAGARTGEEKESYSIQLIPGDSVTLDSVVTKLHNISLFLWANTPGRFLTGLDEGEQDTESLPPSVPAPAHNPFPGGSPVLGLSVTAEGDLFLLLDSATLQVPAQLLGRPSHVAVALAESRGVLEVRLDHSTNTSRLSLGSEWVAPSLTSLTLGEVLGEQGLLGCVGGLEVGGMPSGGSTKPVTATISRPSHPLPVCGEPTTPNIDDSDFPLCPGPSLDSLQAPPSEVGHAVRDLTSLQSGTVKDLTVSQLDTTKDLTSSELGSARDLKSSQLGTDLLTTENLLSANYTVFILLLAITFLVVTLISTGVVSGLSFFYLMLDLPTLDWFFLGWLPEADKGRVLH